MSERLRLAVENGHVVLPEGWIIAIDPAPDTDLSFLDPGRTCVLSRSATAQAAHESKGYLAKQEEGTLAAAILTLPRARDAQRATLSFASDLLALSDGDRNRPIFVDGNKTDGVDAFYREVRNRADVGEAWSKAHGKVFTVSGGDFTDWPRSTPVQGADGWYRAPGVFSADGVDKASALLAELLPKQMKGAVVDLGAGWGFLSHAILQREDVDVVHMVEDDGYALLCASNNVPRERARDHWADARTWRPEAPVDHVVTNPPFHTSRKADPELGRDFIRAAAEMLKPKGNLWLVANRHLPYEQTLEDTFHTVQTLGSNPSFKIFHATSPKRSRKG